MKDIEKDLKRAQDRSIEFYARSTQQQAEPVAKGTEAEQIDSARDEKPKANEKPPSADGEEYLLVGEAGTQETVTVHEQKHSKNGKNGKIGNGTGKMGKAAISSGPAGVIKHTVQKTRRAQDGSDKSDNTKSAAGDTTEDEEEDSMDTNVTISQQDLQCLLKPMQDLSLLQQPTYVGPLTAILDRLSINHKAYQTAVENKDQAFFSALKLQEDPPAADVLPPVGSTPDE